MNRSVHKPPGFRLGTGWTGWWPIVLAVAVAMAGMFMFQNTDSMAGHVDSMQQEPTFVTVAAAASMAQVLEQAEKQFRELHPQIKLYFNFGSSGVLQRQIQAGAPVDLFIAAAAEPMDRLVREGFVAEDEVAPLASNRIVLIRPRSREAGIDTWTDVTTDKVDRIVIGNPDHVPAGWYARQTLQYLGLWDGIQPRLIMAENVRQALNYVARGEVDAGIVYASDALSSMDVRIVAEAPAESHPPVIYPIAVLNGAQHPEAARRFVEYLRSPRGEKLLGEFGFGAPLLVRNEGNQGIPSLKDNIALSMKIAALSTLIVLVVGTPLARLLSRSETRGHSLLDIAVNLPLALPPTVIGYFLLVVLGREGFIGKLILGLGGSSLLFTQTAAVIASSIVALPLYVQGARGALEAIPADVYEAAQMDGANRRQMFLTISLPLAWRGVSTGILLAFVRSLGEFGATIMVAGNIPGRTQTMALAIYTAIQSGQDDVAATLALVLTLLAGLSMAVGLRSRSLHQTERRSSRWM